MRKDTTESLYAAYGRSIHNLNKSNTMAEIYSVPDSNTGNNIPFSIPVGGFGNGFLGNGNGFNSIADLFGLAIIASMFGWGNGGWGGGFGGGNGAAGFLSNQINNDTGRDLIMQAVTNQGEASRTAVQTLSTMLGQDFNLVNAGVQNVQSALNQIANAQGVNALQIVNALQAGDANLASQFQQCCCQNQLAICNQTNTLQNSINGVGQQVAAKAASDQLAMCQQTYNLTDTMNRNYLALDNKIDAMESSRKDRELAAKDAEIATLKSQNFTAGILQQAVAPLNAQLAGLAKEVDDIKCKMPNTVQVEYPNLVAVNASPYVSGGFYGNGFFGGNGWGGNMVF